MAVSRSRATIAAAWLKAVALAVLLLAASVPQGARAQGAPPEILPSGCGTANYTNGVGYLTVDSQGHLCGSSSGSASGSPYPFTIPGTMQSQLSVTTGATVALTVPAGTTYFDICVRSGAASSINYSVDGLTTPTTGATGNGKQLNAGQCASYSGIALANNFKAIGTTGTTAIDVEYLK